MMTAHFFWLLRNRLEKKEIGCHQVKAMLKKPSKEDKRTLPKQGGSCHGGVCQTLLEQNVRQKRKQKKTHGGLLWIRYQSLWMKPTIDRQERRSTLGCRWKVMLGSEKRYKHHCSIILPSTCLPTQGSASVIPLNSVINITFQNS